MNWEPEDSIRLFMVIAIVCGFLALLIAWLVEGAP